MPEGIDTVALLPKSVARNVAFVPGAPFYAGIDDPRTMRLSFVTASVDEINTAVAALALTVREQLIENRAMQDAPEPLAASS